MGLPAIRTVGLCKHYGDTVALDHLDLTVHAGEVYGVLLLGLAALAFAIVPRASAGIAYGLVALAFLWDLVGSLLDVPSWLAKLTPFARVGLVTAQPFRSTDALAMLAIGVAAGLPALWAFRRRDLIGH